MAQFVCSTAERLPFADKSFDFVLSSDMMEHLPHEIRGRAVVELTRVARRGVLVGFPGGSAERLDRLTARIQRLLGHETTGWLAEHLEQRSYPDRRTVTDALPSTWRIAAEYPNGNWLLSAAVIWAEMLPLTAGVPRRYERRARRRGMPRWAHRRPVIRTIYHLEPTDPATTTP